MTNTTKKPAIVYVVERQRKGKSLWYPMSMCSTKKASRADVRYFNEQCCESSFLYRVAVYQRVEEAR